RRPTARGAGGVRGGARKSLWCAVGTAAVVGLAAPTQLLPPTDHQAQPAPPAQAQTAARPTLMASLFEMLRSALMSTIIEALRSGNQQSERAQTRADGAL